MYGYGYDTLAMNKKILFVIYFLECVGATAAGR